MKLNTASYLLIVRSVHNQYNDRRKNNKKANTDLLETTENDRD